MTLYNTLTRKKEPLESKEIGMYVCGPTVYDAPHIGHARSAFAFDLLRRYLKSRGFHVTFVRNVTDVDDKIIERARKEKGDLKTSVQAVSERYLKVYQEEMERLGVEKPDEEPKATEYIGKMQGMIQEIIQKEAGYVSGGDVYFSVKSAKDYGKLSKRNPDEMLEGTRGEPSDNKRDPLDFALWKSAKPEEPSWKSPWGPGRPGWHIECSTMSTEIFREKGVPFVIHGGGLDLVFPHHENEIAQAEGAGRDFAKCWVHNGLVTVKGQKMSKSLGNFITLEELFSRAAPEVIRFYFLQTHYRNPLDFSWENLEGAKGAYQRVLNLFERVKGYGSEETRQKIKNEIYAYLVTQPDENIDIKVIKNKFGFDFERSKIEIQNFYDAMDNDLNTPNALAPLFFLVLLGNDILNESHPDEERKLTRFYLMEFYIRRLGGILNLFQETEKKVILTSEEQELIRKREEARKNKDFKKADEIRLQLSEQGIILMDTAGKSYGDA